MSILIQDTARNNLPTWTERALSNGYASGAVLSPFTSPIVGNGYKIDVEKIVKRIRKSNGEIWFDPMTHALQMPLVGDFRYYDQWDLWAPGVRNVLTNDAERLDHVRRVFKIQTDMGAPLLAPTILLHSAQSSTSQQAIELSRGAREEAGDRKVWISIVGDTHFWAAGNELDAHIGALDQLEPAGWFLTTVRPQSTLPVAVQAKEIAGLMRTVYALSQDRPVILGHGDFAGLPAIAAGAHSIGTGWDVRQRVCSYSDYAPRPPSDDGGGQWYARPSLKVLLGSMSNNEYQVLLSQDSSLAMRLTTGSINPGPENAFRHHAEILNSTINSLTSLSGKARVQALKDLYEAAKTEWPNAQSVSGCVVGGDQWLDPLLAGLNLFMAHEGW